VGQVIVVGSVNTDYSVRISHLPRPGETVTGGRLEILPGGKGANQAHAAARLGAAITLIAAVGTDAAGDSARRDLAGAGIDITALMRSSAPSGFAMILVDSAGENMIAVAPGANEQLSAAAVRERLATRLTAGTVVLASLEVPLAAVTAAAGAAADAGASMVINPAPGQVLPAAMLRGAIVTPNEGEILRVAPPATGAAATGSAAAGTAAVSAGTAGVAAAGAAATGAAAGGAAAAGAAAAGTSTPDEDAAVAYLLGSGARAVIITRGSRGASVFRAGQAPLDVPAPRVEVVDTVGAGDAFNGALATALAAGLALETAVAVAVQAGAAACTGAGARQALPRAGDIALLG
jgi:ribokinase